jgi:hypothetical protein
MRWLAVASLLCLAGCSSLSSSSGPGIAYGQQQRVKVGAWIGAAAGVALLVVLTGDSNDTACSSDECAEDAQPPP